MVVSCLLRKYHNLLYIVTTIFYFLLLGHVGPLPLPPCFSVHCQFFPSITPNILRSCLTRSSHRCLGFPLGRLFFGFHFVMGNNSWSSPLQTCLAYLILWLLSVAGILGSLKEKLSSLFDLHIHLLHSLILIAADLCSLGEHTRSIVALSSIHRSGDYILG